MKNVSCQNGKLFLICYLINVNFTFSDFVTLPVCLGFDDVTFYQSLHDLLQPVKMYNPQFNSRKRNEMDGLTIYYNYLPNEKHIPDIWLVWQKHHIQNFCLQAVKFVA